MKVVTEEIQINQRTPNVTLSDGVANVDSEIVSYPIPDKSQLEIRPTDFIGMYLATAVPAELAADSLITVLYTDAQNRRTRVIAQGEYQQFKALQDVQLKYFIKASYIIPANFYLKIKVLAAAAADDAQTRFTASAKLVYETLD